MLSVQPTSRRVIRGLGNRLPPKPVLVVPKTATSGVSTTVSAKPKRHPSAPAVTSKKTSTRAVNIAVFNTKVTGNMTERDVTALRQIKARYAANIFARGDFDVGIIRRLGERGKLQYIDGDPASPEAHFRLTVNGLSY